jgi:PEP-CTERM motif
MTVIRAESRGESVVESAVRLSPVAAGCCAAAPGLSVFFTSILDGRFRDRAQHTDNSLEIAKNPFWHAVCINVACQREISMRVLAVLAAAAVMAMPASAVTLFSQNFDSAPQANNSTNVPGFTVTGGVDLIRQGVAGVQCAGAAGRCLDLVGSPLAGSVLSDPIAFQAGRVITVSFEIGGNPRDANIFNFALGFTNPENIASFTLITGFQGAYGGTGSNITSFGTYTQTVARNRPFVSYALSFVSTGAGSLLLNFGAGGPNDSAGPILDNILVDSAVPEPSTWFLLLSGFGMIGLAARRRRSSVAA